MKQRTIFSIGLLLLMILWGCSLPGNELPPGTVTPTEVPVLLESVEIIVPRLKSRPGQTIQCKLTAYYDNGTFVDKTSEASWSVGETAIASVSSTGLFSPSGLGSTAITAVLEDKQHQITIIIEENKPPIAKALYSPISVSQFETINLNDDNSSDIHGDNLAYNWVLSSVPAGSNRTTFDIQNKTAPDASFLPDAAGDYLVDLTISDGVFTDTQRLTIQVAANTPAVPVISLSAQSGTANTAVTLTGTASADSGEVLNYSWSVMETPTGSTITPASLSGSSTPNAGFTPDIPGDYIAKLSVSDGTYIKSSYTSYTVTGQSNSPPTALAELHMTPKAGSPVYPVGNGSTDPEGDTLTYLWDFSLIPPDSSVTAEDITGRTTKYPEFTPDVPGEYKMVLIVSDGVNAHVSNELSISAAPNGGTLIIPIQ